MMNDLIQRYFDILNGADAAALDGLVAEDCIDHDPIQGQPPGFAGVRLKIALYRATLPDARSVIDEIAPEGDDRARVTWTTTTSGPSGGARRIACRFTAEFVVAGGLLRESRVVAVEPLA